ncbi:ECF-type sigma factor [Dokdonella soli]|uniref:Sigma-70 family RNA polymerase sigma factor n=1 Tax=Dokdonella soli TaxID=529810 RepID=A0ABN1IZ72_9GAMM
MLSADQDVLTEVTAVLRELAGRADSLPRAFEQLQADLRRVAHRERYALRAGETMSTTALVNEAFLKLSKAAPPEFADRRQFCGIAARAMRQVLLDYARTRLRQKRGGGGTHDTLGALDQVADPDAREMERLLEINEALDRLDAERPRLAQVVYLRFYAGLGDSEIGDLLGIEESTVRRDWLKARGWLYQALGNE